MITQSFETLSRGGNFTTHFAREVWKVEEDEPRVIAPDTKAKGIDLESCPLIVAPGTRVLWEGKTYELEDEGRYTFTEAYGLVRNLIVFERDLDALYRSLAQIQKHGTRHNSLTHKEKVEQCKIGYLSVLCGNVAHFTHELLRDLGITSRVVHLLSIQNWNAYDCGHVLLEVKRPSDGKWELVDIDAGVIFHQKKRRLNLHEFIKAMQRQEEITFSPITQNKGYDPCIDGTSAPSVYCEILMSSPEVKRHWFERIAGAGGFFVAAENKAYFPSDNDTTREIIEGYTRSWKRLEQHRHIEDYVCLPEKEWLRSFYAA